jgi:hypothetical protein
MDIGSHCNVVEYVSRNTPSGPALTLSLEVTTATVPTLSSAFEVTYNGVRLDEILLAIVTQVRAAPPPADATAAALLLRTATIGQLQAALLADGKIPPA